MNREIYTPDQFQPVPGYRDLTPQDISHSTYQIIDLFYSGIGFNLEPGREFLARETSSYLRSAERGFYAVFDKKRQLTRDDTRRVTQRGQEVLQDDVDVEDKEAFNYSLLVFALMHRFSDPDFYIKDFSKSMTLACPSTTAQYLDRIHELRFSIAKLATGQAQRDPKLLQGSSPMVRTYAYFKVGDEIPLKYTQSEKDDTIRQTIDRLTADIPGLESF